ncbi:hypothetical protein E2C01_023003 [Portunus trituberculatus]|uniref:Uncharacterized protein n=1 Tax=Portunus trituberculatus TaxID=210409 RepID=A0A5B7EA11_PORTR|nr:hypothetical protein [Portunus trituberculatus]
MSRVGGNECVQSSHVPRHDTALASLEKFSIATIFVTSQSAALWLPLAGRSVTGPPLLPSHTGPNTPLAASLVAPCPRQAGRGTLPPSRRLLTGGWATLVLIWFSSDETAFATRATVGGGLRRTDLT